MSEQERINLFERIGEGILRAQQKLYEEKARLGESVVVSDSNGMPLHISGAEALKRISGKILAS